MQNRETGLYFPYQKEVNSISYLILILMSGAMILDLCYHRIPNWYLCLIWPLGMFYRVTQEGWQGLSKGICLSIIPIILLYFLYQMRVLGAGDIKLFSAVGVYLSYQQLVYWIVGSFISGAIIGVFLLIKKKILIQQLFYFSNYIKEQVLMFPNQRIYQNARIGQDNVMHFTIAMVVGYCLVLWRGL